MPEIISGKDEVLDWFRARLHVHSWQTVRRWKKKGLPVHYLPNQVPFIIPHEVIRWALKYDQKIMRDRRTAPREEIKEVPAHTPRWRSGLAAAKMLESTTQDRQIQKAVGRLLSSSIPPRQFSISLPGDQVG